MEQATNPPRPTERPRARLATVDVLLATSIPALLSPSPSKKTLIRWLKAGNISRLKANPGAKRGGGICWWSVSQVERMLRMKAGLIGHGESEGGAR